MNNMENMKKMAPSELKEKLFEILKQINIDEEPLFIDEKGEEPEAVLVSLDEFELMSETI